MPGPGAAPGLRSPRLPPALTTERLPLLRTRVTWGGPRNGWGGGRHGVERLRQHNPLGADGAITRAAERIPLVNNVVQGVHRARGREHQLERARERNPLGTDGYITKFGEHIPVVADGIRAIHHIRGQSEAEERARAFSLSKMLSKDGAITKLAELLPVSNLLAAGVLELKGEREEAAKALDIKANWMEIGNADGALARVAELLPGVDIVAFGIMMNNGNYASALRTLTKTRWVDITADCVTVLVRAGKSADWLVLDIESDLEVRPKAATLSGGLLDIFIHLLDFNSLNEKRWPWRRLRSRGAEEVRKRFGMRGVAQSVKLTKANEVLGLIVASITDRTPELLGWTIELANWSRNEWEPKAASSRRIMRAVRVLFPSMTNPPAPSAGASLIQAIQDSLAEVTAVHGPMPRRTIEESSRERPKTWMPEACGAVSCLSCFSMAACGVHAGPLACLTGCVAAATAAHRTVKANLVRWLNSSNDAVWEWMSAPVVPLEQQSPPPEVTNQSFVRTTKRHRSSPRPEPASASSGSRLKPPAAPELPSSLSSSSSRPRSGSPSSRQTSRQMSEVQPTGIIFEWPRDQVVPGSEHVRKYFLYEFLHRHWLGWLLWLFEHQLFLSFLNDAVDGQAVPLAIPIPLAPGVYSDLEMWLPEIRVMLILELRFTDQHYITGVTVAVVDGLLDQVANTVKAQSLPKDLRELDARLADFMEPIELRFDVALSWPQDERLRLELRNVGTSLHLPQ